jgi:bifunctional non-homologous end joining protein LigD
MSLAIYRKKRDFKNTSEPSGRSEKVRKKLQFVVQQHAATHLHYDFRLELEGVLKSWAIPKGPSMNPKDKRLAMMVEDHPYDYKNFEGKIPQGNYGAGNVIVWDNGTYEYPGENDTKLSEKKLLAGLRKGHISFILYGKKLKGEYSLLKLQNKKDNSWLLVKKNDQYASDIDELKKDKSVISNKPLTIPENKSYSQSKSKAIDLIKKHTTKIPDADSTKKANLNPQAYDVMLAGIKEDPFNNPDWLFEPKYDGYRALAMINNGEIELFSRNHLSFNKLFSLIISELKKIKSTVVIDGEVVVENAHGVSQFQLLQNYQRTGKGNLKYYVFDLLHLNGIDVRGMPLIERKELLQLLVTKYPFKNIILSPYIIGNGIAQYKKAEKKSLEGIIAKEIHSPYRAGRKTGEWLKIKITNEEEAIICGITEPKGSRNHFGSLILGMYKNKKLIYIGNCGTGFTEKLLTDLYKKFKPIFIQQCPFATKPPARGTIQWLKPQLVCQVKFTEWTESGQMRHPVFLGLRIDKSATEVTQKLK